MHIKDNIYFWKTHLAAAAAISYAQVGWQIQTVTSENCSVCKLSQSQGKKPAAELQINTKRQLIFTGTG